MMYVSVASAGQLYVSFDFESHSLVVAAVIVRRLPSMMMDGLVVSWESLLLSKRVMIIILMVHLPLLLLSCHLHLWGALHLLCSA